MKQQAGKFAIALMLTVAITSCGGKSGTKAGNKLKGDEAKEYLAGKTEKEWVLDAGHDYYEYILFKTGNGATILPGGTNITFTANGDKLIMKDYRDIQYTILEIGAEKLIMQGSNKDTLVYILHKKGSEAAKKWSEAYDKKVNPKWLKGTYGTTWQFSEGGKMYSYMNDGSIIDAATLRKVETWKIEDKTLHFGVNKLTISRLTPIFFDYTAFDIPVKLNYVGPANADGSLKRL